MPKTVWRNRRLGLTWHSPRIGRVALGTRLRSACSLPHGLRTPARGGYVATTSVRSDDASSSPVLAPVGSRISHDRPQKCAYGANKIPQPSHKIFRIEFSFYGYQHHSPQFAHKTPVSRGAPLVLLAHVRAVNEKDIRLFRRDGMRKQNRREREGRAR